MKFSGKSLGVTLFSLLLVSSCSPEPEPAQPAATAAQESAVQPAAQATAQAVQPAKTVTPTAVPAPKVAAPVAAQPIAVAPVSRLTGVDQQLQTDLKNRLASEYDGKLSFPLDETKMVAFVQLADRVKKVNDRWDVLVASAETDQMAIEYNNLAINEITAALKGSPELPLEQYTEMTKLTATDAEFNKLYLAYRQMLASAAKQPAAIVNPVVGVPVVVNGQVAPSVTNPAAQSPSLIGQPATSPQPLPVTRQTGTNQPATSPIPTVGATPSTAPAINPAVPANPNTAPVQPGSTAPQYSQPVSR